jgi:dihydroflavonol-4-reductase
VILVTGGTGLVGSHLLVDLCKSGKRVRVTKRRNSNVFNLKKVFSYYTDSPDVLLKNIEWVDADLLDIYSLMDVMKGVSEVYHCAAMVSFEPKYEEEMMRVNIEGTANMVNAALECGVTKFCHVSSVATIGTSDHVQFSTEELIWKSSPEHSNYAISKYGAEREVWRASEEGLNVIIVNPSMILGPGNWTQSSSTLFANGYKGQPFYTSGVNGFVDVRDVAALMVTLMDSEIKNQRYLLSAENVPYKQFLSLMHEAFGKSKPTIKIGKGLIELAWRAEKIRCFFTGATPVLTKETARSANRISYYSNKKIKNSFPEYKFIAIEQSVKDTCKLFLKDLK